MQQPTAVLQQLLDLTQAMYSAASQQIWSDVTALESQRKQLLPALQDIEWQASDAALLQQISELNQSLLSLGDESKQQIEQDLRDHFSSDNAIQTYRRAQGML